MCTESILAQVDHWQSSRGFPCPLFHFHTVFSLEDLAVQMLAHRWIQVSSSSSHLSLFSLGDSFLFLGLIFCCYVFLQAQHWHADGPVAASVRRQTSLPVIVLVLHRG